MPAAFHLPRVPDAEYTNAAQRGSDPSDLVRRAQAGDVEAFEALYRAHVGRVHALCLRMCGDAVQAAELVQDVFVQAWERLASFRGESALGSWLHRLAVNVVLARARAEMRREARVVAAGDLRDVDRGARMGSPEARMDLEQAIAALPPGARTVFVLHDVEGYRHHEIARLIGLAEGTVRAQLHRARRLLMEALDR